jgi:hypothetical protein
MAYNSEYTARCCSPKPFASLRALHTRKSLSEIALRPQKDERFIKSETLMLIRRKTMTIDILQTILGAF